MEKESFGHGLSDPIFDKQEVYKEDNKNKDREKSLADETDRQKAQGEEKILRQNPLVPDGKWKAICFRLVNGENSDDEKLRKL